MLMTESSHHNYVQQDVCDKHLRMQKIIIMHILTSTIAHLTMRVSPSSEGTLMKGMRYNSR